MAKPLKILKASAGSGKTFSLAAHYLSLLFTGNRKYREILAVTFTNKATEEMKTRILEVLEGFAKGSPKVDAYREIVLQAHPELSPAEFQIKADEIYRQILHDYSRFSVGTLDGFMQKVIRGFTFELNLSAGYSLDINQGKVIQELAERLKQKLDFDEKLLQWIIDMAYDRIDQDKNWNYQTELINLTQEVFKDEFEPFALSVQQMGEQADEFFQTYVALCQAQIKDFEDGLTQRCQQAAKIFEESAANKDELNGTKTGSLKKLVFLKNWDTAAFKSLESLFKLIDDEERWFKKGKRNSLFDELNPQLHQIQDFFQQNLPEYILAKAFKKKAYFLKLMAELAELLKEYRSESESLLISDAQKLLQGIAEDAGENPSFIWEKMGQVYKHFLFDEFQDTSGSQWNSFRSLVENAIAEYQGKQADHLIVGDTKQAIYGWRGGDYKLLHQVVKAEIGEMQVREDNLQDNRRSSSAIIDFNNQLYKHLPLFLQEQLNASLPENSELQAFWFNGEDNFGNLLPSIYADGEQRKHDKTPLGGKVRIRKINPKLDYDSPEEGEEFADKESYLLHEMLLQVKELIHDQGYKQRELGVLVRSNKQAAAAVEALMEAGYDVISGDALKIANNSAVKLILEVLKYLSANTQQQPYYLGNITALYAKLQGRDLKGADFMHVGAKPLHDLSHLLPHTFIQQEMNWMQLPISELLEQIIEAFVLPKQAEHQATLSFHIPFLLAFKDLCAKASINGEKGIIAFLHWWDQEGFNYNLPSPETANAIQVMTIHKSKGLAFRAVLVPFCNWELKGMSNVNFWVDTAQTPYQSLGSIPLNYESSLANSAVAKPYFRYQMSQYLEALNNLYVATTRAIDFIYLGFIEKGEKSAVTKIGDALWQTLPLEEGSLAMYETGEFIHQDLKLNVQSPLVLDNYPTSKRLHLIYEPQEEKALPYLMNIAASAKRGEILHRMMAESSSEVDLPEIAQTMVLEGLIRQNEVDSYVQEAQKLYASTQLQQFFIGAGEHLNERAIISKDGATKRPDKIILDQDRVRILDYKFTLEQSQKHHSQLQSYKMLLTAMGFAQVEAYLYYAHTDQLVQVY